MEPGLGARLLDGRAWARDLVLATGLALFLVPIGPFGSYGEPIGRRLAECLVYSWTGALIWSPGFTAIRWLAARWRIPDLPARLAAAVILAAPIAVAVTQVGRLFWPVQVPPRALDIYPQIAAVALPLALFSHLIRTWMARAAQPAPFAAPRPARLIARLPAAVEGEVLALQAEDHYVRVHTARGSTLILMRMADAIAELDGLAGLQVHRSWWVARAAVTGAQPAGRRASLLLVNGLAVPVSRAAMPQARASGFLGVRA